MTQSLAQEPPAPSQGDDDGMSLADLEHLRRVLPGCEITMLADVTAGTVLGASAAVAQPQEVYDRLAGTLQELIPRRLREVLVP